MGKPCIVTRTGYTGEDGFELVGQAEDAPRVWENLMLAGREHGIAAVGLGARDTLRLEAGMPLYGHELNESTDPFRAGLGFAVSLGDRTFLGSVILAATSKLQQPAVRVGLKLEGRRVAAKGQRSSTRIAAKSVKSPAGPFRQPWMRLSRWLTWRQKLRSQGPTSMLTFAAQR